ncbi:MAG TPA: phasin family protein [Beijerinckiaceae bacterium]
MAAFAPVTLEGVAPLAAAFQAGADQARAAYDRARENGDTFRQAVTDTTAATTRGFLEFNGKVIDLVRAQNEAALDLWRSTLTAGSFSEAIRAQTHGMREAYETSAAQWKDLAETAGRLMGEATQPLRSAFQGR